MRPPGNATGRRCGGKRGCGKFKPWSSYNKAANGHMGYQSICRDCMKKYTRKIGDRYRKKNKERRRIEVFRRHGITERIFNEMLRQQHSRCAICGEPSRRTNKRIPGAIIPLSIDHSHVTGKVRGLLCHTCNSVLGLAGDSIDTLKAAAAYLERHFELLI